MDTKHVAKQPYVGGESVLLNCDVMTPREFGSANNPPHSTICLATDCTY